MSDPMNFQTMTLARLDDEAACQRLCVDFANHIDARRYDALLNLFTEDGVLDRMGAVFAGATELRKFLMARSTTIVTRHLCTNFRMHFDDADHASGFCYVLFFQSEEMENSKATAQPCVLEYEDRFRRTPEGWRIQKRQIRMAIRG